MAPITDSTVSDLKDLVHKLEARVHQLEARLGDGGKKPKSLSDSMRMILIGPPGAGEPSHSRTPILQMLTLCFAGKGTQAPLIKDKYCVCHLVSILQRTLKK
jgi:adenylate kinase